MYKYSHHIWALLFVVACIHLHAEKFWQHNFFDTGSGLLIYSVSRTVVAVGFFLIVVAVGDAGIRRLAPGWQGEFSLEGVVHRFFVGASVLSLLGMALAQFRLLDWTVILVLLSPFLLQMDSMRIQIQRLTNFEGVENFRYFYVLLALLVTYILLCKGLPPDFKGDALAHYIPYYQSVFDSGGIVWPTVNFYDYFFLKGAGYTLLLGSLGDINLLQLASFTFYLASGALVWQWLRTILGKSNLSVCVGLLVLYFIDGSLVAVEFQKTHMMSGAFLLYCIYILNERFKPSYFPLYLILLALVLMNPSYLVFVLLVFGLQGLFLLVDGDFVQATRIAIHSIFAIFIGSTLLLVNYFMTGIAEVTPASLILKMSDPNRRPPGLLLWFTRYTIAEEGAAQSLFASGQWQEILRALSGFLWGRAPSLSISALASQLLVVQIIGIYSLATYPKKVIDVLRICFGTLLGLFILRGIINQGSFLRGLVFLPALRILLIATLMASALKLFGKIIGLSEKKKKGLRVLVVTGLLLVGAFELYSLHKDKTIKPPLLALGGESFGDYYGFSKDDPCTEGRQVVGPHERMIALFFRGECYGKPTDLVDSLDPYNYTLNSKNILLESPEQAMRGLRALGINHFIFSPGQAMYIYSFYPLFQREAVEAYFTVEKKLSHGYLLTWRREQDKKLSSDFLREYQETLELDKVSYVRLFYESWLKKIESRDP